MKEIGEKLKEARESIGVSTTEVAEDLKLEKEQIENIENGNVESFKDVFYLKYFIRDYAKYLGLDKDELVDDFNEYLFDYTSKISLEDIKAAQKKLEEEDNKIKSPYTQEYKNKIGILPFILGILCVIVLFILIYVIVSSINKAPTQVDELMPREECVYEFTY